MNISKECMVEFASLVATAVVDALEKKNVVTPVSANGKVEKTAYQKTEQLLYNYNGFMKIIKERELEIETLRKYGVPQKSLSIVEYTPHGSGVRGLCTDEEAVEAAVANVQASVQSTVQAIALIDKCMASLADDPYYDILEMRYFDGRTQDDIAAYYGVSQVSISKNKKRLVTELSIRLFPDQSIQEMLS